MILVNRCALSVDGREQGKISVTIIEPLTTNVLSQSIERRSSLVDRMDGPEAYALAFGGQGTPWLEPFADLIRDFALEGEMTALVSNSESLIAPVARQFDRVGAAFDPVCWAHQRDGEAPANGMLSAPAVSVPGILLTQLAGLQALRKQGIDPRKNPPVAVVAHSQGHLASASLGNVSEAELLAVARMIGVATTIVARRRNLLGDTMVSISNVLPERIEDILAGFTQASDVVAQVRNGRRSVVVSGPPEQLRILRSRCEEIAVLEKAEREHKRRGGAAFAPVFELLDTQAAFHHPALAEAADLVQEWSVTCGLDAGRARTLTMESIVDPVDWVAALDSAADAGARWLLDVGPSDLMTRLSSRELRVRGVTSIATTTRRGHRELTTAGAAPRRSRPWAAYAPTVVSLPDGQLCVETRFTRLTGRSPILLAGMTPTTVDAAIVAAAANAGFWAELAGGGQVTEPIFADRIAEMGELLEPGRSYQFNTVFLDPYLWKMQIGQKRLVQRARADGAAIDAMIVSAGVPEREDAAALIQELRAANLSYVVFKPGTLKQIRAVIDIARDCAPTPIIVQIEGGKAGGHHSWEDLDEILLASYGDLRACDNIVVCVGGGIGTPGIAATYLDGTWALAYDYPPMPLDGILVGTAAMATLEATTTLEVKALLVQTGARPIGLVPAAPSVEWRRGAANSVRTSMRSTTVFRVAADCSTKSPATRMRSRHNVMKSWSR